MKQTQIRFLRFAVRAVVPVLAVSAVMMAQDQAPGGWRRVGDPAPDAPAATAPPPAPAPGADMQDPAEPVDRSDQYGQPGPSSPQPSQANPPAAAPRYEPAPNRPMNRPAYGLPARLTLQPGTFISVRMNQRFPRIATSRAMPSPRRWNSPWSWTAWWWPIAVRMFTAVWPKCRSIMEISPRGWAWS